VAVDHFDLEVQRGEVVGLLGHNGAGKTTTVRLLNGVLTPDEGRARVLGLDPGKDGVALRARVGVLMETPALDERLTARELLSVWAEVFDVDDPRPRIERLLEELELDDRADERISVYSKGMKQRLALVRTLLHDPEVLYLDEPTVGLDPVAAHLVHERIAALSEEGRTLVLCTHNLVEAQRLCHRVAVLQRGAVLALGAPRDLVQQISTGRRVHVEVEPGEAERARALVGDRWGAVDVGEGALWVHDVPRADLPSLSRLLVEGGASVYAITPEEPTLEDFYLSLHGALSEELGEEVA
jgi:ABC-2 type transport system ATP-binding protein